jgi:hypothetical protein
MRRGAKIHRICERAFTSSPKRDLASGIGDCTCCFGGKGES